MRQLAIIITALWVAASVWFVSMRIEFNQNCVGFLKQAADANTIELALDRLERAIHYVEKKGWTEGYTSVLWRTEDENIGFWYTNLKASHKELICAKDSPQYEQTNVLMKLRESLTENTGDGTSITFPMGLWKYPYNGLYAAFIFVVNLLMLVAVFIYAAWLDGQL